MTKNVVGWDGESGVVDGGLIKELGSACLQVQGLQPHGSFDDKERDKNVSSSIVGKGGMSARAGWWLSHNGHGLSRTSTTNLRSVHKHLELACRDDSSSGISCCTR